MDRDCISHSQWRAMVWAGLMAPMVELFPGVALAQAGKGAWLSVLLAWVGVLSGPLYMGIQAVLRLLCGLTGFPFALVQYYFF